MSEKDDGGLISCKSCRFFMPHEEDLGECVRYPPVIVPCLLRHFEEENGALCSDRRAYYDATQFPTVNGGEFCGEYQELVSEED